MELADLDLNLLVAFDAIHAEGSVSRAAVRIGVRQPAMSETLRRLRILFGDPLFVRAAGAMQPTPKARALAAELSPLLAQMRALVGEQAAFLPKDSVKAFRVASTDYTTLVLLPELMRLIAEHAPGVDLRIIGYDKDSIGGMLDRCEIDLAIGTFSHPPHNSVRVPLWRERFVGLARVGHPAVIDGTIGIEPFAQLSHALVSIRRDEIGAIDTALAALGLQRRVALVVPYMLLLPGVLSTSDLVATVPERAARALATPRLIPFSLPLEIPDFGVEMLWNPVVRTDKASLWLRNVMVKAVRGD